MPIHKRIPRVVSHDSDSSSEDEEEAHSTLSSVSSGQLYTTPSTELPEIHTSSFSFSSSSEYEDFEESFSVEQTEVLLDNTNTISQVEEENSIISKRDNSAYDKLPLGKESAQKSQLSSKKEALTSDHATLNHPSKQDIDKVTQTVEDLPLSNDKQSMFNPYFKAINLQVYTGEEDMDISEDEIIVDDSTTVDKELIDHNEPKSKDTSSTLTRANQQENELNYYLEKFGITSQTAFTKYCILKLDRLHCNFNPSEIRGCQIHFPKDSFHDLVLHLKLFHGIECDIHIETEKMGSITSSELREQNTRKIRFEADDMSVSSIDELLYNEKVTDKLPINTAAKKNDYDPEVDFIDSTIQPDQSQSSVEKEEEKEKEKEIEKEVETVTIERPKTKAELKKEKKERKKNKPFVSRITPKVLRSRTTSEPPTSLPRTRSKSSEPKIQSFIGESKGRGKAAKSTSQNSTRKSTPVATLKKKPGPPAKRMVDVNFAQKSSPSVKESEKEVESMEESTASPVRSRSFEESEVGERSQDDSKKESVEIEEDQPTVEFHVDDIDNDTCNDPFIVEQTAKNDSCNSSAIVEETTNNDTCNSSTTVFEEGNHDTFDFTVNLFEEAAPIVSDGLLFMDEGSRIDTPQAELIKSSINESYESSRDEWPITLGFGFYTKNRYHCNVNRSSEDTKCCKAAFKHKSAFIQHLNHEHTLDEEEALKRREKEETEHLGTEIAGFILVNNVLSNAVEDEGFKKMTASMRGFEEESFVMPTPEYIRQLLHKEYINYKRKIMQLLRNQDHLSFSTQVWKPDFDSDNNILIITASYVNSSWKIEEVILAFYNIPRTDVDASGMKSLMEAEFTKVIKSINIEKKYHSILVSDIPTSSHNPLEYGLTFTIPNAARQTEIPYLDHLIEFAQKQIFRNLETRVLSFNKINNAHAKSSSFSNGFVEVTSTLRRALIGECIGSIDLKDISSMIEKYNLTCISHMSLKQFTLNRDDRSKIKRLAGLIQTLKMSLQWLERSSASSLPTASMALLICMLIMSSLRDVAEMYGLQKIEDLISENQGTVNQDDSMKSSLKTVFNVFYKYKSSIEKMREVPLWHALILDTATFAVYDANTRSKQPEYDFASASEVSTALSVQFQAFEIEHILNEESKQDNILLTAPNSPTPMNNTENGEINRGVMQDSTNSAKRKRSDDNSLAEEKSALDNSQHKRKRTEGKVGPSPDFHNYIYQFKKDQFGLLTTSGIDYASGKKIEEYNLLSGESKLAQIRFWEDVDKEYYSNIARLTKKSISVPVTMKECLRASEKIKKYYTGLRYLYPNADLVEIQEKALIHIWRNENNVTLD